MYQRTACGGLADHKHRFHYIMNNGVKNHRLQVSGMYYIYMHRLYSISVVVFASGIWDKSLQHLVRKEAA